MKAKPKGKTKPRISTDPPASKRATVPRLAAEAPAAAPADSFDWKADPDLRAFACLLSFDAGWMSEPADVRWTFEKEKKIVEVLRPEGSGSLYSATRGPAALNAEAVISEVRRRWGFAVAQKVEIFVFPERKPPGLLELLGPRAQYLRQLSEKIWLSPSREGMEAAFVDVVRTCGELVRSANTGDQSASASQTRTVAAGRILELINPPSPRGL